MPVTRATYAGQQSRQTCPCRARKIRFVRAPTAGRRSPERPLLGAMDCPPWRPPCAYWLSCNRVVGREEEDAVGGGDAEADAAAAECGRARIAPALTAPSLRASDTSCRLEEEDVDGDEDIDSGVDGDGNRDRCLPSAPLERRCGPGSSGRCCRAEGKPITHMAAGGARGIVLLRGLTPAFRDPRFCLTMCYLRRYFLTRSIPEEEERRSTSELLGQMGVVPCASQIWMTIQRRVL